MAQAEGRSGGKPRGGGKRAFAPWSDPRAKPLLRLDNVTRRFGDVSAVDRLSLDIYEGEFFALLGPSGCGKTTLMRLIAGFETPSEGRIMLAGDDLGPVPPYRRSVNMMFQSYALFPHMTVEGNVAFGLKQDGMPRAEIAARVRDMLALVRLEGFEKRKPHQLSGGQAQRVALARALVKRPKVLLLDEPLAALDRKLRDDTRFELLDLQTSLGLTFIIVTHDREEAMTLADRIAVMDHGRLVQVATPVEIYEQPRSCFVADFIGDVNLIKGRLVSAGPDGAAVEVGSGAELRAADAGDAKAGDGVWLGVRPEKVAIGLNPPPGSELNRLSGHVVDIAYLGDVSIYKVWLDNGVIMKAVVANPTRRVAQPIGWDDQVWLSWPPESAIVLTR